MSHITLAQQGLAAVEAKNWDEALAKLSKALQSSTNPAWLVARSKVLVNLKRFPEALDDANLAWHAAYERNRRPLMVDAQYRRAVAYYRMGQYANADCCCMYAMRLVKGFPAVEKDDPKAAWTDAHGRWTATLAEVVDEAKSDDFNRGNEASGMALVTEGQKPRAQVSEWRLASTLRMQILRAMESLPADDAARQVTVSLKPEKKKLADKTPAEEAHETPQATTASAAKPPVSCDTPLRLQEFQNSTTMSVSIFSKGVDKEKLTVAFLPSAVCLDPVVFPSGEEKSFRLDLWGEIDQSASKYTVTPSKVELSLVKKTPGKWPQLKKEATGAAKDNAPQPVELAKPDRSEAEDPPATSSPKPDDPQASSHTSSAPAYPSSSRSGPKDWDKIGADEADDDEGDVNVFFKKLYKNATPEQQRAMMKSFTESNGTSLSTDWDNVKGRKVDTVPPEGVEAREWES